MRILSLIILLTLFVSFVHAQDPGDNIFNEPEIYEFQFHFNKSGFLNSLYKSHEFKEYMPVRLEVKEYRFDGLKKINLNNGWNDPTMLREKLFLDFLWDNNIPAPRANFAKVYIDTIYWGFYTLVEHVDKIFLTDRFGNNDGNLYKSEYAPLSWEGSNKEYYYDNFDLKTNEQENDWTDLLTLINIINDESNFNKEIENILNLESHLKIWAANNLFVNMDSYFGSGNNYYLYQNEIDGRFEWIIWDVNLAFGARSGMDKLAIFYLPEDVRPLHRNILYHHNFRERYVRIYEELLNSGFDEDNLYPKIDALWQFIQDDYLADTLKMYTDEEVTSSLTKDLYLVPALKPFVNNRRESILNQLDSLNISSVHKNDEVKKEACGFQLLQNYPNPFNSTTTIPYSVIETNDNSLQNLQLTIYSVLGQKITTLDRKIHQPGNYKVQWNTDGLTSGFYYYRLENDQGFVQTKRLLLLK